MAIPVEIGAEGMSGSIVVISIAASLPWPQFRISTSPGLDESKAVPSFIATSPASLQVFQEILCHLVPLNGVV